MGVREEAEIEAEDGPMELADVARNIEYRILRYSEEPQTVAIADALKVVASELEAVEPDKGDKPVTHVIVDFKGFIELEGTPEEAAIFVENALQEAIDNIKEERNVSYTELKVDHRQK